MQETIGFPIIQGETLSGKPSFGISTAHDKINTVKIVWENTIASGVWTAGKNVKFDFRAAVKQWKDGSDRREILIAYAQTNLITHLIPNLI